MNTPHPDQFGTWEAHLPLAMHRDLNYGPLSNVPDWKADAVKGIPGAKGWYNESGKRFRYINAEDRDRMPDEISADWAIDIIRKEHDRPFYLAVGFVRPTEPNQGCSDKPLDGQSLLPLLNDPSRGQWEGPAVAFMGIKDGKFSGAPGDKYIPHFSVRSSRFRYTLCGNGEEELYDHERDPNEWTNLASDPEHAETRKKLREEMTAILRRTEIPAGFPIQAGNP